MEMIWLHLSSLMFTLLVKQPQKSPFPSTLLWNCTQTLICPFSKSGPHSFKVCHHLFLLVSLVLPSSNRWRWRWEEWCTAAPACQWCRWAWFLWRATPPHTPPFPCTAPETLRAAASAGRLSPWRTTERVWQWGRPGPKWGWCPDRHGSGSASIHEGVGWAGVSQWRSEPRRRWTPIQSSTGPGCWVYTWPRRTPSGPWRCRWRWTADTLGTSAGPRQRGLRLGRLWHCEVPAAVRWQEWEPGCRQHPKVPQHCRQWPSQQTKSGCRSTHRHMRLWRG